MSVNHDIVKYIVVVTIHEQVFLSLVVLFTLKKANDEPEKLAIHQDSSRNLTRLVLFI